MPGIDRGLGQTRPFFQTRPRPNRSQIEALMYKISTLGIGGNFFDCIKYMYSHSTSHIKLIQKLSEAIDTDLGTEQGHPLSPELFKIFIKDLSDQLDKLPGISSPKLNDTEINHLLWADDLVLLTLDPHSLQSLLDVLKDYVDEWELEVNIGKTNIMVFNSSGRLLLESYNFTLGNLSIAPARHYCYLGITFSLNGSFKTAISTLTSKAKRAFHQLRRTIDADALSVKSLFTLFDSLILPVITYASQIWLPYTNTGKSMLNSGNNVDTRLSLIKNATKDTFEVFHLRYIKWVLGVHKRASNVFCYGDTGRYPVGMKVIPQSVNYFWRVEDKAISDPTSLVGKAFVEQKELKLEWYNLWNTVSLRSSSPVNCQISFTNAFEQEWNVIRSTQSKLTFYNEIKDNFGPEIYLDIDNRDARVHVAKLRSSAHDLNLETGRYATKSKTPTLSDKTCRYCCGNDKATVVLLEALPHFDPILESEAHVLTECPAYHHLRLRLSDELKCHLLLRQYSYIMTNAKLTKELGIYLKRTRAFRKDDGQAQK